MNCGARAATQHEARDGHAHRPRRQSKGGHSEQGAEGRRKRDRGRHPPSPPTHRDPRGPTGRGRRAAGCDVTPRAARLDARAWRRHGERDTPVLKVWARADGVRVTRRSAGRPWRGGQHYRGPTAVPRRGGGARLPQETSTAATKCIQCNRHAQGTRQKESRLSRKKRRGGRDVAGAKERGRHPGCGQRSSAHDKTTQQKHTAIPTPPPSVPGHPYRARQRPRARPPTHATPTPPPPRRAVPACSPSLLPKTYVVVVAPPPRGGPPARRQRTR